MNDFLNYSIDNIDLSLCTNCAKCDLHRPISIWQKMPEGCGFEGWLFQAREAIKQAVRIQKEELILLEIAQRTLQGEPLIKVQERIDEIRELIQKYAEFGSENW